SSLRPHASPHSFPTRRSSDLILRVEAARPAEAVLRAEATRPVEVRAVAGASRPPQLARSVTKSIRVERAGLPIRPAATPARVKIDRKSTRLNSSHVKISYAVF